MCLEGCRQRRMGGGDLAEQVAEGDVLRLADLLSAEEDDLIAQQRCADLGNDLGAE